MSIPSTGPVPSPCINVCRMGAASGLCEGCGRTLKEIAAWASMPDDARRLVWASIAERRAAGLLAPESTGDDR